MPKDKPDIWMPLYIGDYLADTMHLTTEQHGAYLLLLMAYWKKGGPLDKAAIKGITRLSDGAWSNACSILQAFFKHDDKGRWIHKRVEAELESSRGRKAKAIEKAKKAAEARWSDDASSNACSMPEAMLEDMLEECPSSSSSSLSSKSPTPNPPLPPKGFDLQFEKFWEAWPVGYKVGKDAAKKSLKKALKKTTLETILHAIEDHKKGRRWKEEYIPNPTTWLNQGRWEDEITLPGIPKPPDSDPDIQEQIRQRKAEIRRQYEAQTATQLHRSGTLYTRPTAAQPGDGSDSDIDGTE